MAKLYYDFSPSTEYQTPLNSRNLKFREYIDRYVSSETDDFDDLLTEERDSVVLQNLSNLRSGLLRFYSFREGSSILEIGAAFGALTENLVERGFEVTVTEKSVFRAQQLARRINGQLDIFVGDIKDMKFEQKFDYIILIGVLEKVGNGTPVLSVYSDYLKMLASMLNPEGKILLAVDNRLGLRFLAGNVDSHTSKPFRGINNYPDESHGRSFTKPELDSILESAGLSNTKYYYPLPDYRFPQLIYTDEYLPEENVKERLIPYYFRKDTLVFDELNLYTDIVKAGAFPALANSYFVECATDAADFCPVRYAALSTDRGIERSFVTAINSDNSVTKTPMFEKGQSAAHILFKNIEELRTRGIPVIDEEIDANGVIYMPYISYPTLSNYIKKVFPVDIDQVYRILDRIYEFILQSSDVVSEGDDGPILRKAYMELIPLNCFYNEQQDEYIFFDQEFVKENCPAKYIMFRAIHYIYCFTPNAEAYCSIEKMKERYDLTSNWDTYLGMERAFLDEVRNHHKYSWFYNFARADRNIIRDNINKLASEAEKKDDYNISDKMKRTWKIELSMLDEVDRICKKYNLTYFLVHGSLLGAVRHKGFIPWDDDLDIAMKRSDYETFLKVACEELGKPLSLILPQNEPNLWWGPFARIMNLDSTAILPHNIEKDGHQGIWIDILPIDYCTKDEALLKKKLKKLRQLHMKINAKVYGHDKPTFGGLSRIVSMGYKLASLFETKASLCERLNQTMQLYNEESSEVAIFTGYQKIKTFNTNIFDNTVLLEFEGRKLPAPVGYKDYLFRSLGGDYMKFPPEEERKPKHRGIFDPDRPYSTYQEKLVGIFDEAKRKKIILFGSGLMFEDYMKKYGDKYRPAFLVDNDANKWERTRLGLEIKKPEAILEIPKSKRLVIICSYYYKEIEPQLVSMGVTDYKIYVQEMEWILKSEEQAGEKHL